MTHIGARRARAVLGMLIGAVALLMSLASPAMADLDIARGSSIEVDGDTNWWNGTTITSYGGYQYAVYWDAPDGSNEVYPVLTRRPLAGGSLESIIFNGAGGTSAQRLVNRNDGHDVIIVGLSPNDGRVHLSWSVHHSTHHYGISERECMSQARLTSCRFDWSRWMTPEVRDTETGGRSVEVESTLTYPYFFNDSRGRLYFSFRFGQSFRGNAYMNVYNDNGTWTSKGLYIKGRFVEVDWTAPFGERCTGGNPDRETNGVACHRGVYVGGSQFDKRDRLHVFWEYKEYTELPGSGLRGIYYMYSDDYGTTWYNSAGTRVGTSGREPILPEAAASTATEVVSEPFGTWPGVTYMTLDSNNQPHLVIGLSDVTTGLGEDIKRNSRLFHIWLTGRLPRRLTWNSEWIEPEGHGLDGPWGTLMFDGADTAYYIYNHNALDWAPYNSTNYVYSELTPDHVTWQSGRYLNIVPMSAVTALDSGNYIGIPISTRAGAGSNNTITVRMKNNTPGRQFQLYWQTDASPRWLAAQGQEFRVSANDTEYQTYTFTMTRREWTGTLRSLEIYPAGLGDVHGERQDISIDYIRIGDERGRTAKAWEFNEGNSVRVATSAATSNWASWRVDDLLSGVSQAQADSVASIDKQRYIDSGYVDFPITEQGAPGNERISIREFQVASDTIRKDWSFTTDDLGWTVISQVREFAWASDGGNGVLQGTLEGGDSAIGSQDKLGVRVGASDHVWVHMKNSTASRVGRLWFVTDASPTYNSTRSRDFTITARDTEYSWYEVDLSSLSGWTGGTLKQLRIDPSNDVRVTEGSFRIDRVAIASARP